MATALSAVSARICFAAGNICTRRSPVSVTANAVWAVRTGTAGRTVGARIRRARVDLEFAQPARTTRPTVAAEVVYKLNAVEGSFVVAGIREAFVNISFASWPNESGRALALKSANPVEARSAVVAGALKALVDVDFAEDADRAVTARANKVVDQVVASATVVAGAGVAIVDVEFTVEPLKAFGAVAGILAQQVTTSSTILARMAQAFIDFALAIAPFVANRTNAAVAVAEVFAHATVVADVGHLDPFLQCGILTRDHGNITQQTRPPRWAYAAVSVV